MSKIDYTIDTDEQGDFVRFFNGDPPIRGDVNIIRFLYREILKLPREDSNV